MDTSTILITVGCSIIILYFVLPYVQRCRYRIRLSASFQYHKNTVAPARGKATDCLNATSVIFETQNPRGIYQEASEKSITAVQAYKAISIPFVHEVNLLLERNAKHRFMSRKVLIQITALRDIELFGIIHFDDALKVLTKNHDRY